MTRVAISCEGDSERLFVKEVLYPYFFENKNIFVEPIELCTKRENDGSKHAGGTISFIKTSREIKGLLQSYEFVTTFYDFFRLKHDFFPKDFDNLKNNSPYEKVKFIEDNFANSINNYKFLPYIQLHEFEAFAFIDSNITINSLSKATSQMQTSILSHINKIQNEFNNKPELINSDKAPSKRILEKYNMYEKTTDGINIAKELGIHKIMECCPHFKEWIEKIENFGN